MAPSGHRRNLHPCRTGDSSSSSSSSTNKIGRTKHCSVRYNRAMFAEERTYKSKENNHIPDWVQCAHD